MENTGLSVDLLIQIFVVLEGLALWKVPVPIKETIVDSEQCCDSIWKQVAPVQERSKEVQSFLTTEKRYNRSVFWASCLCSYAPLALFLFLILFLSIFFDIRQPNWKIGMTFSILVYLLLKIVMLYVARHYARKYDMLLKKYTPVDDTTKPDKISKVD